MHGKTSFITHNGQGIFKDIPCPFEVMRYHSLIVEMPQGNQTMEVTAVTSDEEIMSLKVKGQNTYGVQFHPESILTQYGKQILKNFLSLQGGVG
jgi:anthranilate/para-aminobenzoate synthase component II